jgi:hypothetical protein
MDAKQFVDDLVRMLNNELDEGRVRSILTFEEAGMLPSDPGFEITLGDGSEFQVTVVQSKATRD